MIDNRGLSEKCVTPYCGNLQLNILALQINKYFFGNFKNVDTFTVSISSVYNATKRRNEMVLVCSLKVGEDHFNMIAIRINYGNKNEYGEWKLPKLQ